MCLLALKKLMQTADAALYQPKASVFNYEGTRLNNQLSFSRTAYDTLKGYSGISLIHGLNHRETVLDSLERSS